MSATTRGRRLRSTPRPRDRREQLASIAADLFRRHGYHNVGVGDIAAAAGITGPAVYRHFPSKQAILGHVVLSGLDGAAAVVTSALAESDGSADAQRLATLAAALSSLVVERRELGALWRREGRNLPAGDRAELAVRARRAVRFGVDLVQRVRPALGVEDAELLCCAALSVYGSVSDHHVTLPKARFEGLLTSMALAVVHDRGVPAPGGLSSAGAVGATTPRARLSRREQLLTLAARMFREHGFHAVTMEDIGAAAGITGPSIYRHYAGKADLLVAMCNRIGDRLRVGVEAALAHPPRRALEELTASFVHTVLEYRDLVAAYLVEGDNLPDRDRAEVRRLQRNYVAEWATLLLAIDPTLDEKSARVRVHAAFAVVNDIARTARFASRPHLPAELATLAMAVLTPG